VVKFINLKVWLGGDTASRPPVTSREEYEKFMPQERVRKHQEAAQELKEALTSGAPIPVSAHAAVKRALGSAKTFEMRVNEQSVPSTRSASTTPKVDINVSDSLDAQTINRAQHISNIHDSIRERMPNHPNSAVLDAGYKSLVGKQKAVQVIKKGSA